MKHLSSAILLLVAVFLTCAEGRCGYRNRIPKRRINNQLKEQSTELRNAQPNITTSPKPTARIVPNRECILQNGKRLKVGEKYTESFTGACDVYECKPERVTTETVKCPPAMCVDYVTLDGACCPSCPTGK